MNKTMKRQYCTECGKGLRLVFAMEASRNGNENRDAKTGLPNREWVLVCPQGILYKTWAELKASSWHTIKAIGFYGISKKSGVRKRLEDRMRQYDREHRDR